MMLGVSLSPNTLEDRGWFNQKVAKLCTIFATILGKHNCCDAQLCDLLWGDRQRKGDTDFIRAAPKKRTTSTNDRLDILP